jgi:hypothetical protein
MEEIPSTSELLAPVIEKLKGWAAGPNPAINTPDEQGRVAGFWLGLWHGASAPVALALAVFRKDVHVFEVHNTGNGYVAGFLVGLLAVWGGSKAAAPRRRR